MSVELMMRQRARALVLVAAALTAASFDAFAQSRHLAPGFTTLPPAAQIVLMPTDIELFSISAGGVLEPKADWTDAASKHFKAALIEKKKGLGAATVDISDKDADEFGELNTLHAAIARSIANHHFGPGFLKLPTKDGKLDWSLGDAVKPLKDRSKADYALFSWIRDSYASGERVAAMVALALFGIVVPGGIQVGYASLIDLNSGQVLWFNLLARTSGDLRERDKAAETLEALLTGFPQSK